MPAYSITQNTFFLTAASVLQKIISFVYFALVARWLGVQDTGQYFFAIAFTTVFTVIADFGLGSVLTREAAKYPEKITSFIGTLLPTKIVFGLVSYCLLIVISWVLGYDSSLRALIAVSGCTMFFDNLQTIFYSTLRSQRNLTYESFGMVSSQLVTLGIGTCVLWFHLPTVWLLVAYLVSSMLNLLFAFVIVRYVCGIVVKLRWERTVGLGFLRLAIPFALAGIIARLYAYVDSILMSKLLGPEHLGWWSVPYKITFAFQFIPIALATSLYPVVSALSKTQVTAVAPLFEKASRYLFLLVCPLVIGLGLVARPFILFVYGQNFLPSVPVLQLLLVSLFFGFLSFITGAVLNATNRQSTQTALFSGALVVNVIINIVLLPRIGVLGAAAAALVGNMVLFFGGYFAVYRIVRFNHANIIKNLFQALVPAICMGVIVFLAMQYLHFGLAIVIGIIAYGIFAFMSGGIEKHNVESMFVMVRALTQKKINI